MEQNEAVQVKAEIQPIKETLGNVQTIQMVLKEVMKLGCHYDKIHGCGDKPVLLKAGAEKILSTFRIGVESIIEDLSDDYERRYRVTCRGFYIPTGNTVGYGVGEGATSEKKYAWREAVCQEEYDETEETKRQKYWKKGYQNQPAKCVFQVRQNPSDIANTVLKMAKKRAMVDLCLTATACSDIFDQDLDEEALQDHIKQDGGGQTFQKPSTKPQQTSNQAPSGDFISEAQSKRMFAIVSASGYSKEYIDGWLRVIYGIEHYNETPWSKYKEICDHIENGTIPAPRE